MDRRVGRLVVVRAVLVGIEDTNRHVEMLNRRHRAHAGGIPEREDDQDVDLLLPEKRAGLPSLLHRVHQIWRDDIPDGPQILPQSGIHVQPHALQLGKLVPVVEMPQGKKPDPWRHHALPEICHRFDSLQLYHQPRAYLSMLSRDLAL